MGIYQFTKEQNGIRFQGVLNEIEERMCVEEVHAFDMQTGAGLGVVHSDTFDSVCLGDAGREGYVKAMTNSAAFRYFRDANKPTDCREYDWRNG